MGGFDFGGAEARRRSIPLGGSSIHFSKVRALLSSAIVSLGKNQNRDPIGKKSDPVAKFGAQQDRNLGHVQSGGQAKEKQGK